MFETCWSILTCTVLLLQISYKQFLEILKKWIEFFIHKNLFWHNFIWIVLAKNVYENLSSLFCGRSRNYWWGVAEMHNRPWVCTHMKEFLFFMKKKLFTQFFLSSSFFHLTIIFIGIFFLVACFHRTNIIFEVELIS